MASHPGGSDQPSFSRQPQANPQSLAALPPSPPARPLVIAHRGTSRTEPENTLAAFQAALSLGPSLHGIELDVQFSADGHPVLFHDEDLGRVGRPGCRVRDLPLWELQQLDVGSWHSPQFAGTRMPTLADTLAACLPHAHLLVELKLYDDQDRDDRDLDRQTEDTITALLSALRSGLPTTVSHDPLAILPGLSLLCFDDAALKIARRQAPGLACVRNLAGDLPGVADLLGQIDHLSAFSVHVDILTREFVAFAHSEGRPVYTFTCNDPGQVESALACGVDGIMSDDPAWLSGYLGQRQWPGLSTAG